MGTSKTLQQNGHDITVEDLYRIFAQVAGDQLDAAFTREALRLMISDPARARRTIAANPDLAVLEGLLDLVEDHLLAQPAAQLH